MITCIPKPSTTLTTILIWIESGTHGHLVDMAFYLDGSICTFQAQPLYLDLGPFFFVLVI
jgi:hypothetical protein